MSTQEDSSGRKTKLSEVYPEIAGQWHPTRNVDFPIERATSGSRKLVWWQCPENKAHEWQQRIIHRIRARICSYCVREEKSLARNYPEIAKEWHSELNGLLKPEDVAARGSKKVWWQCPTNKNHVYEASICNRTSPRRTGCPFCAGKQVDESNSLETHAPKLAKEWHPSRNGKTSPKDFTYGSAELVWWQCSRNKKHEWATSIKQRAIGEAGCPFCANRYVCDDNRLSVQAPEIAAEWHPTKNRIIYTDASRGSYFMTLNNFIAPHERANRNKRRLSAKDVPVSGREVVWWKCKEKGHEWQARISSRTLAGQGCPYCSGRRVIANETSLGAKFPALIKQWHPTRNKPLTPFDVAPMTDRAVWWRCHRSANHVWKVEVSKITKAFKNGHTGCPFCANRRVCIDNNLAAKFPSQVKQMWHRTLNSDLEPVEVTAGSMKVAWFQCPHSSLHVWKCPISQITRAWKSGNSGCAFCKGLRFAKEESLSARYPELTRFWHRSRNLPLKPSKISARSQTRVWWRCGESHVFQAAVGLIVERFEKDKSICRQCEQDEKQLA